MLVRARQIPPVRATRRMMCEARERAIDGREHLAQIAELALRGITGLTPRCAGDELQQTAPQRRPRGRRPASLDRSRAGFHHARQSESNTGLDQVLDDGVLEFEDVARTIVGGELEYESRAGCRLYERIEVLARQHRQRAGKSVLVREQRARVVEPCSDAGRSRHGTRWPAIAGMSSGTISGSIAAGASRDP